MKRWPMLLALALASLGVAVVWAAKDPTTMKEPTAKTGGDVPVSVERMTMGGGCFWCLEAVFQRLEGVVRVVSGYAGGAVPNPTYEQICTGDTGHAEVVQITFDPQRTSYAKLLQVFWAAHDPTTVLEEDSFRHGKFHPKGTAYQGNDVGSQYRSAIYYESEAQKTAALTSRDQAQPEFKRPIATEIAALKVFYPAEAYHQNYYNQNQKRNPYCSVVITPKLQKLLKQGMIAAEPRLPAPAR